MLQRVLTSSCASLLLASCLFCSVISARRFAVLYSAVLGLLCFCFGAPLLSLGCSCCSVFYFLYVMLQAIYKLYVINYLLSLCLSLFSCSQPSLRACWFCRASQGFFALALCFLLACPWPPTVPMWLLCFCLLCYWSWCLAAASRLGPFFCYFNGFSVLSFPVLSLPFVQVRGNTA